jgi:hypothetical protein
MRFFETAYDGGKDSNVTGYWLLELKSLFSIVFLRFDPSDRENFHSHAFNALSWFITGPVVEERMDMETRKSKLITWYPSFWPKYTPRDNVHKVHVTSPVWAVTVRGPWVDRWIEYSQAKDSFIHYTHGRKVLKVE